MNTKGFTLTELIVTIALIGIISMIAFPSISKLKENNKLEKYKAYEKVMETGAKLYVDSKKADLFNDTDNETISYSTLLANKLIEKFEDDRVECSSSYVTATKNEQVVSYDAIVICKQNGKEVYNTLTERYKSENVY